MKNMNNPVQTDQALLSLQSLTAAALVLPGLLPAITHAAEDDSVDFQYSHYQEGKRDLYQGVSIFNPITGSFGISGSIKSRYNNPIEVDSIHGSGRFSLTDRIKFAFNYQQDTWAGATPIGTAPAITDANGDFSPDVISTGASPFADPRIGFFRDSRGNNYYLLGSNSDGTPLKGAKNNQLTHVMSYASPETRKQGDFKLMYAFDEAALDIGGGISVENDYESRFVNLGGQIDFNQKQTTVNLGVSYTNSDTFAKLDPEAINYFSTQGYDELLTDSLNGLSAYQPIFGAPAQIESFYGLQNERIGATLRGKRQDWGVQLGLTQVINPDAVLDAGFGYTRSTGFLANPYKLVYYFTGGPLIDGQNPDIPIVYSGDARLEKRPEERNLFNWRLGYSQYVETLDAALHFNYHFVHDDWGINAHTFEADWVQPLSTGWSVTPRIRYYSQSGADFYTPFVTVISTGFERPVLDSNGNPVLNEDGLPLTEFIDTTKHPEHYSSDQRLSGFGALSGGVTVAKQFAKGVTLETGFEYYTHQGGLKIGGGGEQAFADYDYWVANAALKVNLEAATMPGLAIIGGHSHHQHSFAPAGIMFDHGLGNAGDFMFGYRYMRGEQAGNMLWGSNVVTPDTVQLNGCNDTECNAAPRFMTMSMHMLDLMYAPIDWLTLMLMPQWVDMDMDMTELAEADQGSHRHAGFVHAHQSGGIGDTGIYALFKLFDQPYHHLTLSLGGTAPSGDVGIKLRKTEGTFSLDNVPLHYGMQLGSGTWDFRPSLTYTGEADSFSWGAQLTGTKRLESRNSAGFAFGDIFQGSVWGGYRWTDWLATTVRGIYTTQGSIRGEFVPIQFGNPPKPFKLDHVGTFDYTSNYGGRFWDLGLGLNVTVPTGAFAGNSLKFEWLQPIHTDYNGFQLDRDYALNVTWSYGF